MARIIHRRLEPRMARSLFVSERKRNEGMYEVDMQVQLVLANALSTVYVCSDRIRGG